MAESGALTNDNIPHIIYTRTNTTSSCRAQVYAARPVLMAARPGRRRALCAFGKPVADGRVARQRFRYTGRADISISPCGVYILYVERGDTAFDAEFVCPVEDDATVETDRGADGGLKRESGNNVF